ncbi:hypothetical protein F5Y14DRAFT_148975 [Nemania sp. NC0429]|nr:hypothetical protein F5Y14DRAFT_148975 [Nemania sp. NC0429]
MASEVGAQAVGTQEVANRDVANFLEILRALAHNPSTTWIDQVYKDNETMKASMKEKEDDHDALVRTLTKVQKKLDSEITKSIDATSQSEEAKAKANKLTGEIEEAKKTIADKEKKLQEDASAITTLKGNIETLNKEVKTRDDVIKKHEGKQATDGARIKELEGSLGTTKDELQTKLRELKELQDLSVKVVDGSKEFVLGVIDKIYDYAKVLAFKYYSEDLPEDIIANTGLFDDLRKFVKPIPFPPSNSVAAKKARIAAFLAALGSRLADRIFLPFYTSLGEDQGQQDGIDTIAMMLSDLSLTDPKRELHLRSVLLAIAPEEQKKIAFERADEIANEVFGILGILINPDRQPEFHHDIKRLCHLAVESWNILRPLREKVEPFTETQVETETYWLPAELDGGSQNKKPQTNGKPNGLGSKPSLHSLKSANKVVLVWPGFSYGADVLKQGFMLLDTQVRGADEETQSLKRNMRAMTRAANSSPMQQRRPLVRKSKLQVLSMSAE